VDLAPGSKSNPPDNTRSNRAPSRTHTRRTAAPRRAHAVGPESCGLLRDACGLSSVDIGRADRYQSASAGVQAAAHGENGSVIVSPQNTTCRSVRRRVAVLSPQEVPRRPSALQDVLRLVQPHHVLDPCRDFAPCGLDHKHSKLIGSEQQRSPDRRRSFRAGLTYSDMRI
jgi:hypothetical protein